MKMRAFALRNYKEVVRDPLNVAFALGFPLAVMGLLTALNNGIPEAVFPIDRIAPGMAVFALSFIALFSGTLIAKDRSSALLVRLYASPLTATDFILGYILPTLLLAMLQSAICLIGALFMGLTPTINLIWVFLALVPSALLFIGIGLLCGTLLNDKQVGGICGALLTNLSAWLSGTWFDLDLVGGTFKQVAYALPFAHGVDAGRAALTADLAAMAPHLAWVSAYAVAILILAIALFRRKMSRG